MNTGGSLWLLPRFNTNVSQIQLSLDSRNPIVLGRDGAGANKVSCGIPSDEVKISRCQVQLLPTHGGVSVKAIGMNPISVAGRTLRKGGEVVLKVGESLELLLDSESSVTYRYDLVTEQQFSPQGSMPPPQPR
jgi:hypothetical protein